MLKCPSMDIRVKPEEAMMKKSNLLLQPALAMRSSGSVARAPAAAVPELPADVIEMLKRIELSKEFTVANSLKKYANVAVED